MKMYEKAINWAEKFKQDYPTEDEPLRLLLKIGYDSHNEQIFENAAHDIIYADFPIRKSILELVQYWQA
jgi:hypothetical protein